MALRIVRRSPRAQPQQPVELAARGFSSLLLGSLRGPLGGGGGVVVPQGVPTVVAGASGLAHSLASASSQALRYKAPPLNSNSLTLYALVRFRSFAGTTGTVMSLSNPSGNTRIVLYMTGTGVPLFFCGVGSTFRQATSNGTISDTTIYHRMVARIDSTTNLQVWWQGSGSVSDSGITSPNITSAFAPSEIAVGGYYNDSAYVGGFYLDADVAAAGVIPYAVSDAEVYNLLSAPDYYLSYLRQPVWVPKFAALTLPDLSTSTFKPGTLTASGWTPRITAS